MNSVFHWRCANLKRQIRRCVFETNSSSMHSLVVMKKAATYSKDEILDGFYLFDDDITGEEDCVWEIRDDDLEFGRSPFRALGNFHDKWLYACASLVREYKDEVYNELERIALKHVPGLRTIQMPLTTGHILNKDDTHFKDNEYYQECGKTEDELVEDLMQKEKEWNIEINYWKSSNGYWEFERPYTGYIDEDILSGFLEKENITIEEFLLNKRYVVIQDGDEYCYWQDIKDIGLINIDKIDHEYPERK